MGTDERITPTLDEVAAALRLLSCVSGTFNDQVVNVVCPGDRIVVHAALCGLDDSDAFQKVVEQVMDAAETINTAARDSGGLYPFCRDGYWMLGA